MDYLIIFILTIASCIIFDNLGVYALVRNLTGSYKTQMTVIGSKQISDEQKQKELLAMASKQVVMLLKLVGSIILFISPFLLVILFNDQLPWINAEILYTAIGIGVSIAAVLIYVLLKRFYVKLFSNRKDPS